MKKFLLILLAFVLLAFGGIAFMFYKSFDENAYKAQLIASTKELTGRDMVINGQFSLDIFPSPVIKISDVVIKNKAGEKDSDFIKIASVEAHIQFASLFKNPLIIDNVILNEPQVFLSRNEKGQNNWDLAFFKTFDKAIIQDDLIGKAFVDLPPQFQNMELKNGKISYQNVLTDKRFQLTDINGKIKSKSINGPFDFTGTLINEQMPLEATLHVDKLNLTSQTKFTLSLLNPDSKAVLSIQSGILERISDSTQTISGGFTFNIPKLSSFLASYKNFKDLPEALNKPLLGNGQFSFSAKETDFTDIAIRYGEDNVENAMAANITILHPTKAEEKTKVSALMRFAQLNLDTFVPYLPKNHSWQNVLGFIKNNTAEHMDFILGASQIILNAETIKDFMLSLDFEGENVRLRELKAILPEQTNVFADGEISLNTKEPSIFLNYTAETKNLPQTAKWLKLKDKLSFNIDFISDFKTTGQLRLRSNDLTFSQMETKINNGQIDGGMVFSLTEPKLTGYADMDLNNINFDEFLPYTVPKEKLSIKDVLNNVKTALQDSVLLSDVNFALKLNGKDITFKSLPMQQISYAGKIENKNWTTENLTVTQAAMSNISYSGSVQKLADNSLYFKDVQIDLEMPKSLLLLDRLKIKSPIAENISKIDLKTVLNGSFEKMTTNTQVEFSQGRISAQGNIEKALTEPHYMMLLQMTHPNFHQFVRLFNPSFKSLPTLSGNFTFNGTVKGSQNALSFVKTELAIGAQKITTDLNLRKDENGMFIDGQINSPYLYLDKFMTSKNIFSGVDAQTGKSEFSNGLLNFDIFDALNLNVKVMAERIALGKLEMSLFQSHIRLSDKILMLDDIKASIDGGVVEMNTVLNVTTATPFIKGSVKMDKVPVRPDFVTLGLFRLKNGKTSAMFDFDTKGNSIEDMISSLSSTGRFAIQNGAISSLNLKAFEHRIRTTLARQESLAGMTNQLNKELTVGETSFDSLDGSFAVTNGIFRTSDTVLRTPESSAIMQINFDMPEWTINASTAITMKSFAGYPPISVVVKGLAHHPQTNIDFSSFVKYIESTSSDAKAKLLQEEKAAQAIQARIEAKDRISELAKMLAQAEQEIADTEQLLQMNDWPEAQTELVRSKDALVLLRELAKKPAPSSADIEKAAAQSALISSRTQTIRDEIQQKAIRLLQDEIAQIETAAQEKMHAVHRIRQRLAGVEQIEQAYQKAFSTMSLIQQLNAFAKASNEIEKLNIAKEQALNALDILELTYESIAKFDIDSLMEPTQMPSSSVQGSIRRN